MIDEIANLSFSELVEVFSDTNKATDLLEADVGDIGEIYYCFDEFVAEICRRPNGLEYIRNNIEQWDTLRQASCLSVLKNNIDWLTEFANARLKSEDELLRSAALIYFYSSTLKALEDVLQSLLADPSSIVRGAAVKGLVLLYKKHDEKLAWLKNKVNSDNDAVQEWYNDAIEDYW